MTNSAVKPALSVKKQALYTLITIISAVALPQLCHLIGIASNTGSQLGELLLPMHLPVILAGFLAGPYAGAAAGLASPLISFALTGMPGAVLLPFITVELCIYGLSAGLIKNVRISSAFKVFAVQLCGRVIRAFAIIAAVFAFGNKSVSLSVIWTSVIAGLPGILLQLLIIPAVLRKTEK